METQQAKKRKRRTTRTRQPDGSKTENSSASSDETRPKSLTLQVVDDDIKEDNPLTDDLEE